MDWMSFFTPEVMSAIGIVAVAFTVFISKGKIDQKTAMIVWNFIENIISNVKERDDLTNSEKQSEVVKYVEASKHTLSKKAIKHIEKQKKMLGSMGAVVNLVYNQRKLLGKGVKLLGRII